MKKIKIIFSLLLITSTALALNACEKSASDTLGLSHNSPDEFMVMSHPPLSVPPDFALRAPTDKSLSKNQNGAGEMVLGTKKDAPAADTNSKGDSMLLEKAGAKPEDKAARDQLNQEELQKVKTEEQAKSNSGFFSWLEFWKKDAPVDSDQIVDADKEKKRIDQNAAEGKSPSEGAPATAAPKDSGLWNRIF